MYLGSRKLIVPYKPPIVVVAGGGALTGPTALSEDNYGTSGVSSITTGSFTPSNNSLLIACVSGYQSASSEPTGVISDSETLTWTETRVWPGQWHTWNACAYAEVTTGTSMTVTATLSSGGFYNSTLNVYEFTGYNTAAPITQSGTDTGIDTDGLAYNHSITATASDSITFVHLSTGGHSGEDLGYVDVDAAWTEDYEQFSGGSGHRITSVIHFDGSTSEIHYDEINAATGTNTGKIIWYEVAAA